MEKGGPGTPSGFSFSSRPEMRKTYGNTADAKGCRIEREHESLPAISFPKLSPIYIIYTRPALFKPILHPSIAGCFRSAGTERLSRTNGTQWQR